MKRFAQLFRALDESTRTNDKLAALESYLREAPPDDRMWCIALLTGRRPRRIIGPAQLRAWAAERAGLPEWLFEQSYHMVGDLAETIGLVLPPPTRPVERSLSAWIGLILAQSSGDADSKREAVLDAWDSLEGPPRFLFNKLITGGFRMGVSQGLLTRALSRVSGLDPGVVAHRLMGNWDPATLRFEELVHPGEQLADRSRPYPFCLAHPLEGDPADLGPREDWVVEYKWDGIRAQLIRRGGQVFLWSRGEELITEGFPELEELGLALPDGTVLDGEVLPFLDGRVQPFQSLQPRLGRRKAGPAIRKKHPVVFMAYDHLEEDGADRRDLPTAVRRESLESLVRRMAHPLLLLSSEAGSDLGWAGLTEARMQARETGAEGLMLKRASSTYAAGRKTGDWWKWKADPFTADAVLVYAQAGHGRRANLYTDYTFAVWDGEALVPFAKAYSGLTDAEILEVDRWVRRHTEERFGPVRRVSPGLVFELAFEGIQPSGRHKCGLAVRFPRIHRWRRDKTPEQADTLDTLRRLMTAEPGS